MARSILLHASSSSSVWPVWARAGTAAEGAGAADARRVCAWDGYAGAGRGLKPVQQPQEILEVIHALTSDAASAVKCEPVKLLSGKMSGV